MISGECTESLALDWSGNSAMTTDDARGSLLHLINGFQASQAIHVAAVLGLADLLGAGDRTADDLAAATQTHPASLYRLMRALASIGVFREGEGKRFGLTAVGKHLRSDIAGTQAPMAIMVGQSNHWRAWADLLFAVRTGSTAFDHVHGNGVWEHRQSHPEEARNFDRAMAAGTERFAETLLGLYDFSRYHHVVDIGGGDGMLLSKILAAHPSLRGTLFDLPHVNAKAAESLGALGLSGRCRTIGGDFFAGVPEGGDVYLLKWILHDWNDAASIDILRSCRRAMQSGAKLLVVEHIIGAPNTTPKATFMDINMMVMTGGRERTRDEFAALFAAAGLRLSLVTPTATSLCLIEGVLECD